MQIDFTQAITAKDKAARAAMDRAASLKRDCADRIIAVLDERTLLNIQGAAIAGKLEEAEMEVFRSGRQWVDDMLDACRAGIMAGKEPVWPAVPPGVVDLAARF
ncbi:MAG: hypothetical protein RQ806_06510 [Erythrobacter sp.]|nr:hypothetical protein [Erythrobacter sp.]